MKQLLITFAALVNSKVQVIALSTVLAIIIFLIIKKYIHSQWSLYSQCKDGDIHGVKWHLEQGADINAPYKNTTLLHEAVSYDHKEIVELLIDKGAELNIKDDDGVTPLHEAVVSIGQKDIIELLITNGADINAKTKRGSTPLDWAQEANEDDSLEDKADFRELAYKLRKHGGKTSEELKAEGK